MLFWKEVNIFKYLIPRYFILLHIELLFFSIIVLQSHYVSNIFKLVQTTKECGIEWGKVTAQTTESSGNVTRLILVSIIIIIVMWLSSLSSNYPQKCSKIGAIWKLKFHSQVSSQLWRDRLSSCQGRVSLLSLSSDLGLNKNLSRAVNCNGRGKIHPVSINYYWAETTLSSETALYS